jgi:hypothetical protein
MSALSRFEQFMENVVEGSVARVFRSPVQPAEIAKRLERAMESQQTISPQRVIVPNIYRVFLNPQDFAAFQPIRQELQREMEAYLTELAEERHFKMLEHPKVELAEDGAIPRRTIQVLAETSAQQPTDGGGTRVMSGTAVMNVAPHPSNSRALLLMETARGMHPIPLEMTLLKVGRGLDNDIVLEDSRVSRYHVQLRYKNRRFWVTDLNSTNGSFVNGERITETALKNGDVVSLGGLELTYREG